MCDSHKRQRYHVLPTWDPSTTVFGPFSGFLSAWFVRPSPRTPSLCRAYPWPELLMSSRPSYNCIRWSRIFHRYATMRNPSSSNRQVVSRSLLDPLDAGIGGLGTRDEYDRSTSKHIRRTNWSPFRSPRFAVLFTHSCEDGWWVGRGWGGTDPNHGMEVRSHW